MFDVPHDDEAQQSSETEVVLGPMVGIARLVLIGVVAVAVVAVVAVRRADSGDGDRLEGTVTTVPAASAPSPITRSGDVSSAATTDQDAPQPSVRRLRPLSTQEGPVVLMPFPEGTDEADDELFVLDAGGVRSRTDMPLWPSDSVDPIVMGTERVAFVTFDVTFDRAFQVVTAPVDLSSADPERVGPGSYLVPGGTPDRVWVVDRDGRQLSSLDLGASNFGEVVGLPENVWWVHAATSHGFVVSVDAGSAWGPDRVALLADALEPLEPVPARWRSQAPRVVTAVGDLAVLGWDDHLAVLDVVDDRSVYETDPGYRRLWAVCLSPDSQYLAVKGDAEISVVDLSDGDAVEFPADEGLNKAAWTSGSRLVMVHDGFLSAVGADGAVYPPLAELNGSADWSAAAIGHSC